MQIRKRIIQKYRTILICLAASLLSLLFAWVVKTVVSLLPDETLLVSLIDSINEEWYINTFFSSMNSSNEIIADASDVVIIDIDDSYSSRGNIANVIKHVSNQKPRIICLDYFFPKTENIDKKQSDSLYNTLKSIKDSSTIVVASYKGLSPKISHSYFMDSLKINYGLSDFYDFYNYIPYIDDSIPRLSTKIAELLGINVDDFPQPFIINYRNKRISYQPVKESTDINYSIRNLTNKIVIIGQFETPDDIHTTPFYINHKKQISGIEIISFELSTITSYFDNVQSEYRQPYSFSPLWLNVLFYFIFTTIYFFFLYLVYKWNNNWIFVVKPLLLFLIECLIFYTCFLITKYCRIIPNIILFATSILFNDFFFELLSKNAKHN